MGKSRLGVTAPTPRLILDAEGGSRFAVAQAGGTAVDWDIDGGAPPPSADTVTVTVTDYSTLDNVFRVLANGEHPFRSVVFDSLTEIQQRCVDLVVPGIQAPQLQQWGEILRRIAQLVRQYRDLAVTSATNPLEVVVLLAISGEIGGKRKPQLQGQITRLLPQYVDVIGFLEAEVDSASGETTRLLTLAPRWDVEAKDRTGVLPETVANPSLDRLYAYMKEKLHD